LYKLVHIVTANCTSWHNDIVTEGDGPFITVSGTKGWE